MARSLSRPSAADRAATNPVARTLAGRQAVGVTGKVLRVFQDVAAVYGSVLPFFDRAAEAAIASLAPCPGTRVLDLGCGPGTFARAATARGCLDGGVVMDRTVWLFTAAAPNTRPETRRR